MVLKRHSFFILLVLKNCTFGFADYRQDYHCYIPCYGAFPFTLMHTAEIPTQTPHIRHRTVFSTLHVA